MYRNHRRRVKTPAAAPSGCGLSDLSYTYVGDKGLEYLKKLPLEKIYLGNTQFLMMESRPERLCTSTHRD